MRSARGALTSTPLSFRSGDGVDVIIPPALRIAREHAYLYRGHRCKANPAVQYILLYSRRPLTSVALVAYLYTGWGHAGDNLSALNRDFVCFHISFRDFAGI